MDTSYEDHIPYWMGYPSHIFLFGNFNLILDNRNTKETILCGSWTLHGDVICMVDYGSSEDVVLTYPDYNKLYLEARPLSDLRDQDLLMIIKRHFKVKENINETTVIKNFIVDDESIQIFWQTGFKSFSKHIDLNKIPLPIAQSLALMGVYMFDQTHFDIPEERIIKLEYKKL